MKLQNILLSSLLVFQSVNAVSEKILSYKFHCVKDNNDICSKFKKKVANATNSLSKLLDSTSKAKFEVFVDDVSKYRINNDKDALAIVLDTDFAPLNPDNKNIISPYSNAKALKKKLNLKKNDKVKDRDFIILLNSFKSNKKYLKNLQDDQTSLIIVEIMEGLLNLNKLPYPYAKEEVVDAFTEDATQMALDLLNLRKNIKAIEGMAVANDEKYKKFGESYKLPSIIHWKDTLISEGKKDFPKKKYDYRRIVVVGDIHGDFDKLKNILHHAKLVDDNDDWIGTDSILVQLGDLTDRGSGLKNILDLLIKLREQARERGGIVYMLLGNHELFDMQAGYFVISKTDFDNFGGISEREKALSIDGEYGKLLRNEMNLTMIVDDNLFVHAGLTLEYAKIGIDELNNRVHEILSSVTSFDDILNDYNEKKTHPLYSDPIFDMKKGPLWNYNFSDKSEEEICDEVYKVLETVGAKRMIVGHRIQKYGKIKNKCQSKLILVDIGLSSSVGNYFGYVEILNNKKQIWARYN